MPIEITQGVNNKPAATRELVGFFSSRPDYDGVLLVGFPIIGTADGPHPIDAIWVSPTRGIVAFDIIEGATVGEFQARQDDSANKLEAKLKAHAELMKRRQLLVPVAVVSFAPAVADPDRHSETDYPVANSATLERELRNFVWDDPGSVVYQRALSAIQSISAIRKSRSRRLVQRENSRGAKLKALEDSIATLDAIQSRAVIETVDGVQRIRGLAGSGKTIVLALKAAYLHAQHPEWRIAVTFSTRSLKGQFRRLITNFSVDLTGEEPDWTNLRILNSWGAPGTPERDGIYHEFCLAHGIPYMDFGAARRAFRAGQEFSAVCAKALDEVVELQALYDVVLVDEAQDLPVSFLRMCYAALTAEKRLVYAYDELQNLSGGSVPPPDELFGVNAEGLPVVTFSDAAEGQPKQDVILEKCYRNSRPVLVTAHSLGFGIYRSAPAGRTSGLVQMFDHPQLWTEIGYKTVDGNLRDGEQVKLIRTEDSSPRFLEEHSSIDDLVVFHEVDSALQQAEWVAAQIIHNLREDEMRPDDIVVINPDPSSTRRQVGPIRRRLLEAGINSHLAGVDTDPDVFFQPDQDSVTFTGIYRAKGNEAGMVYIINAQDCNTSLWNLGTVRNRLFTAITRSKAWVRVVGYGSDMGQIKTEFECLRDQDFALQFRYPTQAERKTMLLVHRDMTESERKQFESRERSLDELVQDLENGNMHLQDLPPSLVGRLVELLKHEESTNDFS